MRDTIKNRKHFDRLHSHFSALFNEWYDEYLKIKNGENTTGAKIDGYCGSMVLDFQRVFYLEYSMGLPKIELTKNQHILFEALLGYWTAKSGAYNYIFFVLCYAIIFNIPKDEITPVLDLLTKENYKDFVLDSMANYLIPDFEVRTEELKFRKSTKPVAEVIELAQMDKSKAVKRLKHYLEKEWFNMRKDGLMHNKSHLMDEKKHYVYLGYWCIEAATLVIMFDLDDTILKDCKYYPYDLVHGQSHS